MPAAPAPAATARSPFAGCTVMIAALVVMAFLLGFSIWSLFRLDAEIARFTSPDPRPVPVAVLDDAEAELNSLKARIEVFRGQLGADPPEECELALTPLDLNRSIAVFDEFRDLRGTLHVAGIDGEHLLLDVSFPMNARPFSGESRFLNARLLARPELRAGEIILSVDEIEVPDAPVPGEFLDHFSPYRPLERYRDHPALGPAMKRLTSLELRPEALVLRSIPGEVPPATITDEQVDSASQRLLVVLAIIACAFLVVAATIVVFGLRRSAATAKGIDDPPRL
jgi:hypothetical protein